MSESERRFPLNAQDYILYEEVGEGVSATVYRALCVPLNETVAIKVLDLEKCNNDLVHILIWFPNLYSFNIFLCSKITVHPIVCMMMLSNFCVLS